MTSQVDGAALRALIERVERATGPDQEIDEAVADAIGVRDGTARMMIPRPGAYGDIPVWKDTAGKQFTQNDWTSSLDAVVALVELDSMARWSVDRFLGNKGYVAKVDTYRYNERGKMDVKESAWIGPTPALALLLAFLRTKNVEPATAISARGTNTPSKHEEG